MQFLLDSNWNTFVYTKINAETINIPKTLFFGGGNSWKTLVTLSSTIILGVEPHCGLFTSLFIYSWPDLTKKRIWPLQWINYTLYISTHFVPHTEQRVSVKKNTKCHCAITTHLYPVAVKFSGEYIFCPKESNHYENFCAIRSVHCHCTSTYPMNIIWLADSCSVCCMLLVLHNNMLD